MGCVAGGKQNNNANKNDEKQILLFSFLDLCWHTGSDANNTTHVQKITEQELELNQQLHLTLTTTVAWIFTNLKRIFWQYMWPLAFYRKDPAPVLMSFRSVSLVFVVWGGRADSNEISSFVVFLYFLLKSRRFMSVHLWSLKICGIDILRASLQMHAK